MIGCTYRVDLRSSLTKRCAARARYKAPIAYGNRSSAAASCIRGCRVSKNARHRAPRANNGFNQRWESTLLTSRNGISTPFLQSPSALAVSDESSYIGESSDESVGDFSNDRRWDKIYCVGALRWTRYTRDTRIVMGPIEPCPRQSETIANLLSPRDALLYIAERASHDCMHSTLSLLRNRTVAPRVVRWCALRHVDDVTFSRWLVIRR